MPEICRFYGIVIKILYNDHNPPHFHAEYGDYKIAIRIDNLSILNGKLPPKAIALVIEWAMMHQKDLIAVWEASRSGKIFKIEPLE